MIEVMEVAQILGGSIVGGVFGWLNRKEDRKAAEAKYAHEANMITLQANATERKAEGEAFSNSQISLSKVGDAIKSAFRPIITVVLLYTCNDIITSLDTITGGLSSLDSDKLINLYEVVVLNVMSLTATAVSWWFASRPTGIQKLI